MKNPGSLLDIREGRTKTDILGEVAEAQWVTGVSPELSDLDERIPASKGAISNNCSDLIEAGLLDRDDQRYSIDETGLLTLYREHVDAYLTRERSDGPFDEEMSRVNDVRTDTKRRLREIFDENGDSETLVSVLKMALLDSREASRIRTVPDICYHADDLVRGLAVRAVTSGNADETDGNMLTLFRLAVVLDQTRTGLARLVEREPELQKYVPGSPPELAMLDHVNGGSN